MVEAHPLQAGAAEVDITPPVGITLAGSLTRRHSEGVHDPLYARAVVLESGSTRMVMVLLDMIMIGNEDADRARKAAGEAAGVPPENVCVSCTHTHTGPSPYECFGSPREEEYLDALVPKVGRAVQQAAERLVPARAAWANGWEPRAGHNRRHHLEDGTVRMNPGAGNPDILKPAGPTDPQVPMLLLETASGEPLAVIANFSLHYVGGLNGNLISADYFGVFAQMMKEVKGETFVALLTHGASGDINNIDFSRPAPRRKPGEQMHRVARWVADQVCLQWESAEFRDEVPVGIAQTIYQQRVRKPEGEEIEEARKQWEEDSLPLVDRYYGRERMELLKWPDAVPMVVQAFRVGGFAAGTMTGEIFCRFGLDLKNASPFPVTALIELANGYGGYVPTTADIALGSYETWLARTAFAAPGTGEEMVTEAAKLLRQLYTG